MDGSGVILNVSCNTQFYHSIYRSNHRHVKLVKPIKHEVCFLSLLCFFQVFFFGLPLVQPDVDIGVCSLCTPDDLVYILLHTNFLPFLGCICTYPNFFGVHVYVNLLFGVHYGLTPILLVYTLAHTKILVYMK
jgi:hypothetical protein